MTGSEDDCTKEVYRVVWTNGINCKAELSKKEAGVGGHGGDNSLDAVIRSSEDNYSTSRPSVIGVNELKINDN